jgi:hypothetical protein
MCARVTEIQATVNVKMVGERNEARHEQRTCQKHTEKKVVVVLTAVEHLTLLVWHA